jgi:hypothetical protein
MPPPSPIPVWAPRVPQALIRRLYESDARGIVDDELIHQAGYALLARCESFLAATDATEGRVHCPWCGAIVPRADLLRCACGWTLPWADYFATIQHRQLSGAEPVRAQFASYVRDLPLAATPQARMLLIDRLIHGFHYFLTSGTPTRPVAVNLIEGTLREVVAFLDRLSAGEGGTPGLAENRAAWEANLAVHAGWYPDRPARPAAPRAAEP